MSDKPKNVSPTGRITEYQPEIQQMSFRTKGQSMDRTDRIGGRKTVKIVEADYAEVERRMLLWTKDHE